MKILAVQLKRIGDLILTTPALHALRQKFPEAEITLAVEETTQQLLPAIDSVNETLMYRRKLPNTRLWLRLIFSHWDVCLDFTGNDRSAVFTALSKAATRAGFQWIRRNAVRSFFYNRLIDSSVRENHTIDHYLDLLKAVEIDGASPAIRLSLPEWCGKKAAQYLTVAGLAQPYVAVHPGSARPEKLWLPERWGEIIRHCCEKYRLPCVITGGGSGMEREHIAAVKAAAGTPCIDLSGQVDLLTSAEIIRNARLFLGVDSAAMHLASAFAVPTVALFGPTNPFHWRPLTSNALVLLAGQPYPVTDFLPRHNPQPLSELSTEQLRRAIDLQLK